MGRGAGRRPSRAVLEAITDPEVPPLPPHIRFEQAKADGDRRWPRAIPTAARIIRQSLKGKLAEFVNR